MVDFLTMSVRDDVESFDHSLLTWIMCKTILQQKFSEDELNVVTDPMGTRRRDMFLSNLTFTDYDFVVNLVSPEVLHEMSYYDLVQLLDDHYTSEEYHYRGFTERCDFYMARQLRAETVYQWAARVRNLATSCKFSNKEAAMRDRFLSGLLPGIVKNVMLEQDLEELTLAKTVELAKTVYRCKVEAWQRRQWFCSVPLQLDVMGSSNTTAYIDEERSARNHVLCNSVAERSTTEFNSLIIEAIEPRDNITPDAAGAVQTSAIIDNCDDGDYEQDIILLETPPEVIDLTEDDQ